MAKKAEEKARRPSKAQKGGQGEPEMTEGEKRKAAARSPINGQPVPKGRPFTAGDSRAKEAQLKAAAAKKEKGNLKKLMETWLEEDVGTGKDGEAISGGQMWVRVLVKEAAKGNMKALEMIRDTAGYKPVDRVMVAEVEPAVIAEVEQMVKEAAND